MAYEPVMSLKQSTADSGYYQNRGVFLISYGWKIYSCCNSNNATEDNNITEENMCKFLYSTEEFALLRVIAAKCPEFLAMFSCYVTEFSKKDILTKEMTDKQVEGRTENKLVFSKWPVRRKLPLAITWRCLEKNVFTIQTPKMLQKKRKKVARVLYSLMILPCLLYVLRTCASFPVKTVPKIANTAVWTKSIVALRAYVTHRRGSRAFIDI